MAKDKSIITVVGKDQVGIIARVTGYLYENNVNVEDITQSIVAGFFNMMMIVDTSLSKKEFLSLSKELEELGRNIGVMIKLQREDIFESMQRI
ncbi:MAG: ACT domain-containing protein [Candidatus Ornithospirochaeta sp.]|nr:ACT domain-containing protein [Sphaerochaetaceae bacterium]MDY5523242.1 ACT domain-containing protein [Candidatus Ornithospirochaeta sp.]